MKSTKKPSERQLRSELKRAQARAAELEATVKAIRSGEVDALVVDGPGGTHVFTLQGPEEPYRVLAEGMSEGAAMLTADGTIVFCNQRLAEMAGLSTERLLGCSLASILPEEDRRGFPELVRQASRNSVRTESCLRCDGGGTFPVLLSLSSIPLDAGQGVCLVATDLRDRKRAEEANLRLASIVNSTDDAIIGKTLDGIVTTWNAGAELTYGHFAQEMVGQSITKVIPPDRVDEFHTIMEKVRQGQHVRRWETVRLRKGGREISVSLTVSPIKDEAGDIVGASTIARDITERKRAERALRSLSACNEALVRATDEPSLFQRICDLMVSIGGYRMAWVGYAERDERKMVRVVAQSGFEEGYLKAVNVTWADDEHGRGPTGTAIRTGVMCVCNDFSTDPRFVPWRENAIKRGYRSSLVLPIKIGDEVVGAISIYATDAGAFDAAEQVLLGELGNNLSYGVAALRASAERKRAEEEIRKLNQELEQRVQQRTAQLRESEQSVRRKLDSIMAPEGDLGSLELGDILDIPAIRSLMESFRSVVQGVTALLDLHGNVLSAVGWQDICVKFHRVNAESCKNCRESDLELSKGVVPGEFKLYKCKNNLWDVVTPIMLGGQHMGNLFCGQFFLADEPIDYEVFRTQARKYGFNEQEYMAALERVPRLTREEVNASMGFLAKMAQMISQLSYSSVKLARSMTETSRANEDLAASAKELEAFTYAVAHDLRAPLRHIHGFSDMLQHDSESALSASGRHSLECIAAGTLRMEKLLEALLNLSRFGRQSVQRRQVDLKRLVREVIDDLAPDLKNRQIDWKIRNLPVASCDLALMKIVFTNLLSNAVKFTRLRATATIEIGQTMVEGAPALFVRDNGAGFDMRYASKLFGVFQRLHRAEDFEGTGVGLATVQRILQKHGGRIWAKAEPDKGATFYFTCGAAETTKVAVEEVELV